MKKLLFFLAAVAIAVVGIIIAKPYIDSYKDRQKYEFTLNTIDGEIKLSDYRGKAVAIFFGYMYCPDVCPTALSMLSESLKGLSEDELKNFEGIFISVDPDRDTLKNLKDYAKYFHSNFIGATSTNEKILEISKNYGAYYVKEKESEDDKNYSVAHTSYIYVFDKYGNLSSKLDHSILPSGITKALKKAL